MPGWVLGTWRLGPPRPVPAGHGSGIAPTPQHRWLYSHVLWGGMQHSSCCQGPAAQRSVCQGHSHPAAHMMPHCICHLGSACPGDPNMRKRTQKWGFRGSFGMWSDKCRENINFLRNNLQLYVWKLTWRLALSNIAPSADLRGDSGQASPSPEALCQNCLEIQVHKPYLRESG